MHSGVDTVRILDCYWRSRLKFVFFSPVVRQHVICVAADGQNYVLVPPDGGWGWLVLLGSTLVNMLIPGTLKSFGVLFVEYTFAFHASETVASWIPATCYFLYCSLGKCALSFLNFFFNLDPLPRFGRFWVGVPYRNPRSARPKRRRFRALWVFGTFVDFVHFYA